MSIRFINIHNVNKQEVIDKDNIKNYNFFDSTLFPIGIDRLDPFILSTKCLSIASFRPLLAINPFYQHPYDVLKKIQTLNALFGEKINLNLVTGSYLNELSGAGDTSSEEKRNERLESFYNFIEKFLSNENIKWNDQQYCFDKTKLEKIVLNEKPDVYVASSLNLSKESINNFFGKVLRPNHYLDTRDRSRNEGLALGISIVKDSETYEEHLERRFPLNRENEFLCHLKLNDQSTTWNKWIKGYLASNDINLNTYNLRGYLYSRSTVPYLCGSSKFIKDQIKILYNNGNQFFILDFEKEDFPVIKKIIDELRQEHS